MAHNDFWKGFAAGAAAGAGAGLGSILAWRTLRSAHSSRVLRLEKSIQIGRPVGEVFRAWTDFSQLAGYSDLIQSVQNFGNRSHWVVNVAGATHAWDAELVQVISNQAIGWKSISGPKHTGRITFAPIGNDTLVQITMNYAPPLGKLSQALSPLAGHLEDLIERALRDFKAGIEEEGRSAAHLDTQLGTGTLGTNPALTGQTQHSRFGGAAPAQVEYNRPTQPPPFSQPEVKR